MGVFPHGGGVQALRGVYPPYPQPPVTMYDGKGIWKREGVLSERERTVERDPGPMEAFS